MLETCHSGYCTFDYIHGLLQCKILPLDPALQNFRGVLETIPEELKPYAKQVRLVNMLDFDAVTFDKQIKTNATAKVEITSKFPLVKLGSVCEIIRGVTYEKEDQVLEPTNKM